MEILEINYNIPETEYYITCTVETDFNEFVNMLVGGLWENDTFIGTWFGINDYSFELEEDCNYLFDDFKTYFDTFNKYLFETYNLGYNPTENKETSNEPDENIEVIETIDENK